MTENTNFYFTIHRFMTRDLGLRGSALIIYAIIYSFSADGKETFYGSREMLEELGGLKATSVKEALKQLLDKNLIFKHKGQKNRKKEYSVNLEKLNSNSRISTQPQPKNDLETAEIRPLKSRNPTINRSESDTNNKHNNKQYNKPIINVYNGASAPEREKEIFKEDFLGDKSTAPFPDEADTKVKTEENPIYIKDPASPSENALSDKNKSTAEENSNTLPSQPQNSYSVSGYQKNFRRGEQNAHSSAFPTYKYMNFDPEEAFRLALARTDEWMAQINANLDAKKNNEA